MNKMTDRLIVALDVPTLKQAVDIIDDLGDLVQCYKVGMDAFYKMGHELSAEITRRGKQLFIDLKLHDIPSAVQQSVIDLCELSPKFISVHASGGLRMLKAALSGAEEWASKNGKPRPKIIAITVLTSLSEQDWMNVGSESSIRESVLRMSLMCKEAGIDGVIASPQESGSIRTLCGDGFIIVTPGIRLTPESNSEQARTATPVQAFNGGSDYIIIGRPIFSAASPRSVVQAILENFKVAALNKD